MRAAILLPCLALGGGCSAPGGGSLAGSLTADRADGHASSPPPAAGLTVEGLGPTVVGFALDRAGRAWAAGSERLLRQTTTDFEVVPTPPGHLAGFALLGDTPLVLVDHVLWALEAGGPRRLVEVPLERARLAADTGPAYVVGVQGASTAILAVDPTAGHRHLLDVDGEVGAVSAAGDALFFTVGPTVFGLRAGEELRPVASLPGVESVRSLAVCVDPPTLFARSGAGTYALDLTNGRLVLLSGQFWKEVLATRGEDLAVLAGNPYRLVHLPGIARALAAGSLSTHRAP